MSSKFSNLFFWGRPFSPLYSGIMKLREFLYLKNIKKTHSLNATVISVGNLTMGGTGKTPVVALLASFYLENGFKPAIISRGYGGAAGNKVNVVSDGTTTFLDAKAAGDEPCLLASLLPSVPVLTGIVRILPCRYAIEKLGCNILILDDGFQHISVKRDLDLVLFSAATLAGNSRVFPGGDLREPISALKRCDAFVLTGITEALQERSKKFTDILKHRFPDKPVFSFSYQAVGATLLNNNSFHNLESLPSPLFGFCGIAQPEVFQKTVSTIDIPLTGFTSFRDHQPFNNRLIQKLTKDATSSNAKGLLTTEKDSIKLQKDAFPIPCYSLKMRVEPGDVFFSFIKKCRPFT